MDIKKASQHLTSDTLQGKWSLKTRPQLELVLETLHLAWGPGIAGLVSALTPTLLLSSSPLAAQSDTTTLTLGTNRLVLVKEDGNWQESYWCNDLNGQWHQVLSTPTGSAVNNIVPSGSPSLSVNRTGNLFTSPPGFRFTNVTATPEDATSCTLTGSLSGFDLTKEITLHDEAIHVKLTAITSETAPLIEYFLDSLAFIPDGAALSRYSKLSFSYLPHLRPKPWEVVGDHEFRAPAAVAQLGPLAAAIVPDLDSFGVNRVMPAIIDLDCLNGVVDAPLLSYGFCGYDPYGHVLFTHKAGRRTRAQNKLVIEYDLLLSADATLPGATDEDAPFLDQIAKFQWSKYGRPALASVLPQVLPFEEYARVSYPAAFAEKLGDKELGWWEDKINGIAVGGVYSGWGYDQGLSYWQAWFNNLRSGYGIALWGRRLGNQDWKQKGQLMLNMALAAPQNENGVFPTTYNAKLKRWQPPLLAQGDGYYSTVDMSWKCYWLLRWFQDIEQHAEILDYCARLGDFLVEAQESPGTFPSWFTKDMEPVEVLRECAQTAMPGWFLAELYRITKNEKYLEAATRAGDYIAAEVVPQGRYYDFETFFSCSGKRCLDNGHDHEGMRDPHTQQLPHNTFAMQWSAELGKALYEHTGELKYLRSGQQALDAMIMYQSVWQIPYRKVANTFGGFGVQNSDAEYNDPRQSQFGCTLCDYGSLLGRRDYFERGVAAIRASMALINHPAHVGNSVYPHPRTAPGLAPENVGHSGWDSRDEGRTGFDWGEGGGLAGMAYVLNHYGSVYVDAAAGWAVGVDGVTAALEGNDVIVTNVLTSLPVPYVQPFDVVPVVSTDTSPSLSINGVTFDPGQPVASIPTAERRDPFSEIITNPVWNFNDGDRQGWYTTGNFLDFPSNGLRSVNFGDTGGWFIGTSEDGEGMWDHTQMGDIYSPVFQTTGTEILIKVGGGGGNVSASLLRADTHEVLYTEKGNGSDLLEPRTWDVKHLAGVPLFIRVRDHDSSHGGKINVDDIECR